MEECLQEFRKLSSYNRTTGHLSAIWESLFRELPIQWLFHNFLHTNSCITLGLPVVIQANHVYITFSSSSRFFFQIFNVSIVQEPFATSFPAEAEFSAWKIEQKLYLYRIRANIKVCWLKYVLYRYCLHSECLIIESIVELRLLKPATRTKLAMQNVNWSNLGTVDW